MLKAVRAFPLWFEPNLGQADEPALYLTPISGGTLYFTPTEASLRVRAAEDRILTMTIRPVGHSPEMTLEAGELLSGKSHYYAGSDPEAWVRNVPHYDSVIYRQVYRGIDLVYRGNQGRLEYDFRVAPGADPDLIELEFDGIDGLEISAEGDLLLQTGFGLLVQRKPYVYQRIDGKEKEVSGGYALIGERCVRFEIENYDPGIDLVIDPILYATFFGGPGSEGIPKLAIRKVDGSAALNATLSRAQDQNGPISPPRGTIWMSGGLSQEDGTRRAFLMDAANLFPPENQVLDIWFVDLVTINNCTHLEGDLVACAATASFGAASTPGGNECDDLNAKDSWLGIFDTAEWPSPPAAGPPGARSGGVHCIGS